MGSRRRTIRAAYIGYIRALYDCGAAIFGTQSAPSVREHLDAEQNKCARTITGCLHTTKRDALLSETDPIPLSLRALQLAGKSSRECHASPPPLDDLTRSLLLEEVRPRLQHRAFRA